MSDPTHASSDPDPFLLGAEQIQALAGETLVRSALKHCQDKRVVGLDRYEDRLWARVEDAETEDHLEVELGYDGDGRLLAECQCQRDGNADGLCLHALAALFAYGQTGASGGGLASALEDAVAERSKRGRTEVRVEPVSRTLGDGDGTPAWLGTWRAQSINPSGPFPVSYTVHIRSLDRRANFCSCPDFATNQLGTCKHVEAVLHRLRGRRGFKQALKRPPERTFVYLDWECEGAPRVRLLRAGEMEAGLAALLHESFDAAGAFAGRLPDDLLRLADRLAGRGDIEIGEDALGYARRLAEDAARAVRARDIGERIRAGGGRLPDIRATLYPYQVEGVAFLAGRGRALLADDMGLGKTLQAIAAAYWLHRHERVERVLVVCPASLKLQWAREIAKFTGAEAQIVQGPVAARSVQYAKGTGFFVVNYELILRDLAVIRETLAPDLLILDEAQRIKNWRTKIAAAVKRIDTRYAFVLTGTPLENRLEDLYSLMQVVDPRVLGPLWRYLADFHLTDERGQVQGYRNLSELRRRLAPVMLRRDRGLVRDQLPERTVTRIDAALTLAQQGLHDAAVNAAAQIAQIMKRRPLTPSEQNRMMAALQQARMACDAAELVDPELKGAPKLDELETILDELCRLAGLKAVVFSQWERMTELVEQRVRRMGLGCVRLHGGVPTANRGALIDCFHQDDSVQVFISTDAGGVGLNLQCASVLVNLDIPWNPAVLEQRIARIHRLGQRQRVQILLLVAPESYEERVLGLVQGKRLLFDNVVDPDASEDVVGISRRLAEVLAEDLGAEPARSDAGGPSSLPGLPEETPALPETPILAAEPELPALESERSLAGAQWADEVRRCVAALQDAFGPRIERIVLARALPGAAEPETPAGSRPESDTEEMPGRLNKSAVRGLLVILDRTDEEADRLAGGLSDRVPIALIDRRTLEGLKRLGAASPLASFESDGDTLFEPAPSAGRTPEHPLARQARTKVDGARVLIDSGMPAPALDLLLGALLAAAALRAGRDCPPTPKETAVWLYSEAIPAGAIDHTDAALLMRAIALAQDPEAVPAPLLGDLARDAEAFVGRMTSGSAIR